MVEKIINAFCFISKTIACIIAFVVFTAVVILFLPIVIIAKLFESRQPRNTLWL